MPDSASQSSATSPSQPPLRIHDIGTKTDYQAIGQTVRAAEKLFEAATETSQEKEEKENKRRDVFGPLDETRQTVYDL
jgi:hypothetical protein